MVDLPEPVSRLFAIDGAISIFVFHKINTATAA